MESWKAIKMYLKTRHAETSESPPIINGFKRNTKVANDGKMMEKKKTPKTCRKNM